MNIDEAIKHCEEVASGHDRNCAIFADDPELWQINKEWADNYHHIAEWLKELKRDRKILAEWIPMKTRPLTEEEKEEIGHEYAYIYDCPLPDDGQDVLITDCFGNIEVDTFCRDEEGCYFENNCDDGNVIAWQPLPQPYKAESEE